MNYKKNKNMLKKITAGLISILIILLALAVIPLVSATDTVNNDAPTDTVPPGATNVTIMNFTITDGGDSLVAGSEPAPGTSVSAGLDADWSIDSIDGTDNGNAWDSSTDILLQDFDQDNAYTAQADNHIAGDTLSSVGTTTSLQTTNPFTNAPQVALLDDGDNTWGSGSDIIIKDYHNGGTISLSADTMVNDGGSTSTYTTDGAGLNDLSAYDYKHYVDIDGDSSYGTGDEIFGDQDSDGVYTAQKDTVIDADGTGSTNDYGSDTSVTKGTTLDGAEIVSESSGASVGGGDGALYYVDSDNSEDYTSTDEVVLEPNPGSTTSLTLDAGLPDSGTDNDGDGSADDDSILSSGSDRSIGATDGDTLQQFVASDNVAFEDSMGSDDYYVDGDIIVVDYHDGGTFSPFDDTIYNKGDDSVVDALDGDTLNPLINLASGEFYWVGDSWYSYPGGGNDIVRDSDGDGVYTAQADDRLAGVSLGSGIATEGTSIDSSNPWSGNADPITFYDSDGDNSWDSGTDLIVQDFHNGGTVSTGSDNVVAGNTPSDGYTGAQYTDGLDSDWTLLASYDSSDGSSWDNSNDAIITDADTNGVFQDVFSSIEVDNSLTSNDLTSSEIDTIYLKDGGSNEVDSVSVGSLPVTLSNFNIDITENTDYTVTMDVASGISDTLDMKAETTSIGLTSGDTISVTNSNTQTVEGVETNIIGGTALTKNPIQVWLPHIALITLISLISGIAIYSGKKWIKNN